MEIKDLKEKYNKFINDIDLDELELELRVPNIFEILNISNNEIRHSNFLGWILNPKGNHGLDDLFLKRFLRDIFSSEINNEVLQIEVSELDYSDIEIRREWKNIDLLIMFSDIVVCIENKVHSKEHSNQLQRYKETIAEEFPSKRKVYVYLTPYGENSSDEENYIPLSYENIESNLNRILDIYSSSINDSVLNYLKDYLTTLRRELMGNDKTIELSNRIYRNHKELLDFIIEHKPDYVTILGELLTDVVRDFGYIIGSENKYYVRFTTEKIKELTYVNKSTTGGWRNGESFLFEFQLVEQYNRITFKPVISPSMDGYNTNRLLDFLLEIDGFSKPRGKKWYVPFRKKKKFDFELLDENNEEDIKIKLNNVVNGVKSIVQQVEDKFTEHEDELREMMNT